MVHLSLVEVIDPFWDKNFEPTSGIRVALWKVLYTRVATFARNWNSLTSARDTDMYGFCTSRFTSFVSRIMLSSTKTFYPASRIQLYKGDLREHPNIALDASSSQSNTNVPMRRDSAPGFE
jgi:hypothetical protein